MRHGGADRARGMQGWRGMANGIGAVPVEPLGGEWRGFPGTARMVCFVLWRVLWPQVAVLLDTGAIQAAARGIPSRRGEFFWSRVSCPRTRHGKSAGSLPPAGRPALTPVRGMEIPRPETGVTREDSFDRGIRPTLFGYRVIAARQDTRTDRRRARPFCWMGKLDW